MRKFVPYYLMTISIRLLVLLFLILTFSCKEEDVTLFISTSLVSDITALSAKCGGYIQDGEADSYGVCWSIHEKPTVEDNKTVDGSGSGQFNSYIEDLDFATVYYVRAYAIRNDEIFYGNELSFTTFGGEPIVITESPSEIFETAATLIGTVNGNYLESEVFFEYGLDENYGEVISGTPKYVTGNVEKRVYAKIIDMEKFSTYHYRVVARNALGEAYGEDIAFALSGTKGTMTDIDDNIYETIVIGTQIWMSENLNATHLNDGIQIPHIDDAAIWSDLTKPAYCYFQNDSSKYFPQFGTYYNWYTVNSGKLCPTGWHVPNWEEWEILYEYLSINVGGKMKETGFDYWFSPNAGATNSSGFSGRGGGLRLNEGHWGYLFATGAWWASMPFYEGTHAHFVSLNDNDTDLKFLINWRVGGMNIRCLKD